MNISYIFPQTSKVVSCYGLSIIVDLEKQQNWMF
jgi:hypothetical protein